MIKQMIDNVTGEVMEIPAEERTENELTGEPNYWTQPERILTAEQLKKLLAYVTYSLKFVDVLSVECKSMHRELTERQQSLKNSVKVAEQNEAEAVNAGQRQPTDREQLSEDIQNAHDKLEKLIASVANGELSDKTDYYGLNNTYLQYLRKYLTEEMRDIRAAIAEIDERAQNNRDKITELAKTHNGKIRGSMYSATHKTVRNLEIAEDAKVPDNLCLIRKEPRKTAILNYIDGGGTIDGVSVREDDSVIIYPLGTRK